MAYKIRPELGDKTERDARERIARAKTGKSYGEYRKLVIEFSEPRRRTRTMTQLYARVR